MRNVSLVIKRGFDILISATVFILATPLFIFISILIWHKMGLPVIFSQPRLGYQGMIFNIYKFRSMTRDKDTGGNFLEDDDRITNLGRFLRNTTLDELPELINVLKGEMSVVGPRPLLIEYRELFSSEQWRRHEMKPGMAGPVVAGGRNLLSWEEKFKYDVWYVDNWSLWLDMKILYLSVKNVLFREGINANGHVTMPKFMGSQQSNNENKNE